MNKALYGSVSKFIRYDDLDFLGDDVIDEKTLKDDLGIADEVERDTIMKIVKENKHVKGKRKRG